MRGAAILFAIACSSAPSAPAPPRTTSQPTDAIPDAAPIAQPLAATDVIDVTADSATACAQRADKGVLCWGRGFGPTPQVLAEASGATSLAIDDGGSVCFVVDGSLRCRTPRGASIPMRPYTEANVASVTIGGAMSCLVTTAGEVRCWGSEVDRPDGEWGVPQVVPGVTAAGPVAIGWAFACAVERDRSIRCWGDSGDHRSGGGTRDKKPPTTVGDLAHVKQIVAGSYFACALQDGASVKCWGMWPGSLGRQPPVDPVLVPTAVPELRGAAKLVAANDTLCGVFETGKLVCVGEDYSPKRDGAFPTSDTLALGHRFACVVGTDHRVRCWGYRGEGRLGDGFDLSQPTPVVVDVGAGTLALGYATCSVTDGRATCFGRTGHISDFEQSSDLASLAPAPSFVCALHTDHHVTCAGGSNRGGLGKLLKVGSVRANKYMGPVRVPRVDDTIQLAVGSYFACALSSHGKVQCWGDSGWGKLGRGKMRATDPSPAPVVGLADIVEIRAGEAGACARSKAGAVWCWGGRGLTNQLHGTSRPVRMKGVPTAIGLAVGMHHACVVVKDGNVWCWGFEAEERVLRVPARVDGVSNANAIAAAHMTTCAITGGKVRCWGANDRGQTGSETRGAAGRIRSQSPAEVSGITDATEIAVGTLHACARVASGEVRCWGYAGDGGLGPRAPAERVDPIEVRVP